MLTNSELNTLKLSPTNKDYYQVWTELLDTASKLSERWIRVVLMKVTLVLYF